MGVKTIERQKIVPNLERQNPNPTIEQIKKPKLPEISGQISPQEAKDAKLVSSEELMKIITTNQNTQQETAKNHNSEEDKQKLDESYSKLTN